MILPSRFGMPDKPEDSLYGKSGRLRRARQRFALQGSNAPSSGNPMTPTHDLVPQPDGSLTERETIRLAFDVDAALLVELGERLVARRSVALAEVIKNAYDADATEVIVGFNDVSSPNGEIVVEDNGSGMTLEAMKGGWMRVATNDAAVNARSARFGRPRTGAKGIGRFACGRLASRLSLESVSRVPGGSERIRANFNWRDFAPGRDLSDIRSLITREVVADELPTGTTLLLRGLVDTWAEADVADLQAELADLMNLDEQAGSVRRDPDREADPGFDVLIIAPEFPRFEGTIGKPFLEAAWGVLTGSVADQGEPHYQLQIRETNNVLQHQPPGRLFKDLGGVTFTTRMMVYQGSRFRGSGYSMTEARQLGRERGGVKVYLDGFRVSSYGSSGDDWLDLDQHRARRQADLPSWLLEQAGELDRPMLLLPGNMQLFWLRSNLAGTEPRTGSEHKQGTPRTERQLQPTQAVRSRWHRLDDRLLRKGEGEASLYPAT